MSEAKAFAAGYAAAIKLLEATYATKRATITPGNDFDFMGDEWAIDTLRNGNDYAANQFESWQLSQNPDFQESLAQMLRGEGVEIDFEELVRRNGEPSQDQ